MANPPLVAQLIGGINQGDNPGFYPLAVDDNGNLYVNLISGGEVSVTGSLTVSSITAAVKVYQDTAVNSGVWYVMGPNSVGGTASYLYPIMAGAEDPDGNSAYLQVDSSGNLKTSGGGGGGNDSVAEWNAAVPNYATLMGGSDGTDLRAVATDANGQIKVLVENSGAILTQDENLESVILGVAGASMGKVVLVGGFDGTDVRYLPIASGYVQVQDPVLEAAAGATTSAVPSKSIQVAGSDGTDLRTLLTDTGGQLKVLIENSVGVTGTFWQTTQPVSNAGLTSLASSIQATGSAVPADVVMVGASDGTDSRQLLVDGNGYLEVNVKAGGTGGGSVNGTTAAAAAYSAGSAGYPVLMGGGDGTDVRTVLTDTSGRLLVAGAAAAGAAVAGNPVLMGGSDGTDARALSTDSNGNLNVIMPNNAILAATSESITTSVTTISETAGQNGMCVVVTVTNALGSVWPYNVCVRVRDTTNGIITSYQNAGILFTSASAQLYFNMPITKGDTVDIDVIAPGTVGSSGVSVIAVIAPVPVPTNLRADGRSLPMGNLTASGAVTSTTTLLSAGGSGWRYLVMSAGLCASVNTANSSGAIQGTVGGSTVDLLDISSPAGGEIVANSWENGLLMDSNKKLQIGYGGTSGATYIGNVWADLVPA